MAVALLSLLVFAAGAGAQQVDTVPPARPSLVLPVLDTLPPLSPRRAFLTSLVLPGYAQVQLGRPSAAAVFIGVEMLAVAMTRKSGAALREARRFATDSVPATFQVDPVTGIPIRDPVTGRLRPATFQETRWDADRIDSRKTHREDWLALLAFNHLLAGADAYVAAHLWDLPGRIVIRAEPAGRASFSARIAW